MEVKMEVIKLFRFFLFTLSYLSLNSFKINSMDNPRIRESVLELNLILKNKITPVQVAKTLIINDMPMINIDIEEKKVSVLDENIILTPLMQQILNNQENNVEKIIEEGINVNETIYEGISPLLLAIFVRNQKII